MPKKLSNEEFQEKIKEKFNNEIECLDEFISYRESKRMRFKCKRDKSHNEIYYYSAQNILRSESSGCPFCDNQLQTDRMVKTSIKKKFGNKITLKEKWDYNKNHVNKKTTFICKEHGEFKTTLNTLLSSGEHGCKKCSIENTSDKKKSRVIESIKEKLNNTNITLKESTYISTNIDAIFICPNHGEFRRRPGKVLYGNRISCPYCSTSNGEALLIKILEEQGYKLNKDFFTQYTFDDLLYVNKLRFDIYLSKLNILIEFDGKQHYDKSSIYYDEEQVLRDSMKDEYCLKNNIKLIRFIDNGKDITKSKLETIRNVIKNIKDESSTTIEIIRLF